MRAWVSYFADSLDEYPTAASDARSCLQPVLDGPGAEEEDRALVEAGRQLLQLGYQFTTVTPASHRRVLSRPSVRSPTLRDIFGWCRPFQGVDVPEPLFISLVEAGALDLSAATLRSAVRFSTLGNQLFAHSPFPTEQSDAVVFGPDTYRFARSLRQSLAELSPRSGMRVLDVGAGSGAGGLHVAALLRGAAPQVVLTDINRNALRFSRINAALNRVDAHVIESDLYSNVDGNFDLIVSNPPYLVDPAQRLYRHGGGRLGSTLSLKIAEQGIERLTPGGRLLLYTGSAIVDGVDLFHEALSECIDRHRARLSYEEIDPDVFGEELDHSPYDQVDRIAAVLAVIEVP